MEHILSWIIWLPVIGIVVILFIPREKETLIKMTAAGATGIQLLLAMLLWSNFDSQTINFSTQLFSMLNLKFACKGSSKKVIQS